MNGKDETEDVRRELVRGINSAPNPDRAACEAEYGQVWDTDEVHEQFDVLGFMVPFVLVRRWSDGVKGSLMFQHSPRFYFGWTEDR